MAKSQRPNGFAIAMTRPMKPMMRIQPSGLVFAMTRLR